MVQIYEKVYADLLLNVFFIYEKIAVDQNGREAIFVTFLSTKIYHAVSR